MPDDERTRRRVSDDTKGRIADLASGWSTEATAPPLPPVPSVAPEVVPEPDAPAPRRKAKTIPPPPPGSAARKALEHAVVETAATAPRTDDTLDRMLDQALTGKPTAPPPIVTPPRPATSTRPPVKTATLTAATLGPPPAASRTKPPTAPPPARKPSTAPPPIPPIPPIAARKPDTTPLAIAAPVDVRRAPRLETADAVTPLPPPPLPPSPDGAIAAAATNTPNTIATIDTPFAGRDSIPAARAAELERPTQQDLVPRGEFEHGAMTIKRDAASALLGIAEQPRTIVAPTPVEILLHETAEHVIGETVRGDPTNVDPSTGKFERADPTEGDRPDATAVTAPADTRATAGTLRLAPALRRKRGIGGDVRYVATVVFGVRRSRGELATLEAKQVTRQASRRHHLVTLGRIAATADSVHHPALGRAREQLATAEEQRAQHAGQVAAADAELDRLRRSRDAKAKQLVADLAAIDAELVHHADKLAPLDREAASIRKRSAELRDSIARIDAKLSGTEATLVSVKGPKQERAAVHADIAMLKADREAVRRDEPAIAAELDALNPRIAAIDAARADAQKRRAGLEAAEQEDQRRTEELLAAVGAKRKVVERATADAEAARDKILFELGEQLDVDRPGSLAPEMAPLDSIALDLATTDRRIMELREILSSVDRWKLARGIAVIALVVGALVTGTILLLQLRA